MHLNESKLDYIDALRGWAILGVMAIHCQFDFVPEGWLSPIIQSGKYGVQLFYVVSAFTLMRSISLRLEKNRFSKKEYFLRRFFRIAPLFYFYLIVYIFVYGFSPQYWTPNGVELKDLLLLFIFCHGWHPETINSIIPVSWSISVEFTFYLLLPILIVFFKKLKSYLLIAVLSMLFAVLVEETVENYWMTNYVESNQYIVYAFTNFYFINQLPVFLLGIIAYKLVIKYNNKISNYSYLLQIITILTIISFLVLEKSKIYQYSILYCLLILGLHYKNNYIIVNAFTCFIGKISFSLYLSHWIIFDNIKLEFLKNLDYSNNTKYFISFSICTLISIFISILTYYFIELKGMNMSSILKKHKIF